MYQLPGAVADPGLLVQDLHEFEHLVVAERCVGHSGQQLATWQQAGGAGRVGHLRTKQNKTQALMFLLTGFHQTVLIINEIFIFFMAF